MSVVKESRRQGAKIVSLFQAREDSKEFTLILHFEAPTDTKTGRRTALDHRVTCQTIFPAEEKKEFFEVRQMISLRR